MVDSEIFVYSDSKQEKWVCFVDIIGFSSLWQNSYHERDLSDGDLTASFWGNCIERCRQWIKQSDEVLNFVQFTDSLVIYDTDPDRLFLCVEDLYGAAVAWGVPIRGGVAYGELVHIENTERPGTAMNLGGLGLVRAHRIQGAASGSGMRLFLSEETKNLLPGRAHKIRPFNSGYEYKWWLGAFSSPRQFEQCANLWWGDFNGLKQKAVGRWFAGANRDSTKQIFDDAIDELLPRQSETRGR